MNGDSLGLSLQDVFLLVGMQSRTGELVMESGNNIGTILFHKGKILQASSPYSRAIGDLLVEDGLISESELIETLQLQKKNSSLLLGSLLLKTGKVTFEVIEMMVQAQIRQAVSEFQSWKGLHFSFVDKDVVPYDRIGLLTYEFILPETVKSAENFFTAQKTQEV